MRAKKVDKLFKEAESLVKSIPGLGEALKSIEGVAKEADINEAAQKLKLPYVSAQPIRRTGWDR